MTSLSIEWNGKGDILLFWRRGGIYAKLTACQELHELRWVASATMSSIVAMAA
jgi:hypothetical protein